MISPGSLAAFSSTGAATPRAAAQAAATGLAGGAQRVRAQSASPAPATQTLPKTQPNTLTKPLPRGSLLNLQV